MPSYANTLEQCVHYIIGIDITNEPQVLKVLTTYWSSLCLNSNAQELSVHDLCKRTQLNSKVNAISDHA